MAVVGTHWCSIKQFVRSICIDLNFLLLLCIYDGGHAAQHTHGGQSSMS